MSLEAIILAAGKGTRMHSSKPKVLHSIGGKPMLAHVVDAACAMKANKLHVVVGYGAEEIRTYFESQPVADQLSWAIQSEQLGTGHAVQQALPNLASVSADNLVLILYGDVPLIQPRTLEQLKRLAGEKAVALLTLNTENPAGLGRIIRDSEGSIQAIVEEKDASEEQKKIKEINSGIMVVPAAKLVDWLGRIDDNNEQSEYYLTDIVGLAAEDGCSVNGLTITDEVEVQGVNDKGQLAHLERHYQMTKAEELLQAGTTLKDPSRIDVRGNLTCGRDVEIDVNTIFEGDVTLGNSVTIEANVIIKNATIGDGTKILSGTNIDSATIGENASVGPMARIRPGTKLGNDTKIGNFVETKNAIVGNGSKASHLTYIGDAEIGENVNIGAGTIFCNYDGVNKHKTTVGNDVFVGSNSVLVAPVNLADNTFIAAGSAVNCDVPVDHLAVGRAKQRNIRGWKRPIKK